ncbi:hypothetical protein DAPPUDRAFT_101585 [Daphnia pulex]|uniref:NVL2 nucleolin binding domain-containing protein n=1 Tax=Daphnia pulex TaxID=6669 RepID=E9GDV1_DAPPU|nr:hypothetical protein DAPPUDRAFT_101585 [Daphnia pulex]|eukprot:EFX82415.1 hypothetical protein DAPPUDRAFT_101585 [Daphnia pulex]
MTDLLQRPYADYGRKKKISFRNSVKQLYEDIAIIMGAKDAVSDSYPYETARIADTLEICTPNDTAEYSQIDDIIVIDVHGEQGFMNTDIGSRDINIQVLVVVATNRPDALNLSYKKSWPLRPRNITWNTRPRRKREDSSIDRALDMEVLVFEYIGIRRRG